LYKDGIEKAALSSFEMYHSRHPETCKWLLKRPEFDKWLKCRDLPLLWVHGRPGSGKTTLTSYVVEHLEATKSQNEIQVAYFFMRGMAADPLKELLVSILRQLLERTSQGYNKAQLYRVLASIDHSSSSLSSWRFGRHLKTVLGNLDTIDTLTLVIDGLDELGELSNQIANEIVQLSFMVKESRHVKCLITSRSDCSSQSADDHVSKVNLDENYSVRQDISLVIKDKCAEFCARFPSRRKSLQSLASRFSKQPQTSFLWISLMLHDVSRYFCLDKTNLSLRIDHLPSQIEAIYQQRLASISEHHQMLCSRVFLVVAYAARPLRLGELSAALSISLSGVSDAELIVSEDFLLNRCGGLMTINEDQIVNFVHHSIREYLTSEDNRFLVGMYFLDQVQAHRLLAQACLQCLLQRQRLRVPSRDRGHSSSNHSSHGGIFTFESYAVKYWSLHYRTAESQDRYLAGMLQQLVDISFETCRESNQAPILPQKVTTGVPTSQNKVFRVCAQNGAAVLGQICLEMGVDVNTKFCRYGVSALHVAAASGHADMVELLLRKGAAINARASVQGRTALHYACFRGDTSMVKILLNHGARSDIQTMDYEETPLHMAAAGGHLEVIELLLASGAEANVATSLTEETPLHLAAAYGFVDEASYLLGARWHGRPDVEKVRRSGGPRYPGKQGDEPRLEDRSHLNRNESFGSLLSFGEPDKDFPVDMASNSRSSQSADIGARNRDGWTPLHVAAAWGNLNIIELLLEQGADINAKTFDGSTALCLAEEYGHQAVMSVLCWASQLLADEKDQRGFETICQEPYKNDDDAMNSFFQRNCQINSVFLEGYDDWTAIILDDKTPK
jgi:ankyrin repeat domain-containing protein 50